MTPYQSTLGYLPHRHGPSTNAARWFTLQLPTWTTISCLLVLVCPMSVSAQEIPRSPGLVTEVSTVNVSELPDITLLPLASGPLTAVPFMPIPNDPLCHPESCHLRFSQTCREQIRYPLLQRSHRRPRHRRFKGCQTI